ncbi:N-acetylmuramoyl-L-alanine amidase [Salirhabdus salicampi]|uniref:N-acetylmuramoyl-L-alanine amidase n=1 Tax=Salirhabdus salicampi TaxID=476102 RepID=UPI0020C32B20|nr:N-acetylmuramoyl-L-alanine amidase [Salirhabdus salicampi]MCP8615985.1 N-acetylmuramoyl-L-alanine amidase [Salirhabdus salicampi]
MKYLAFIDDGHGMDTPGKRTPYIEELGRSIKENEFNAPVAKKIVEELKRHNVDAYLTAPGDKDVPLKQRTDFANQKYREYQSKYGSRNVVAVFVSVHYNAYDGSFEEPSPSGIELYVYNGYKNKRTGDLAKAIAKYLRQGTDQNYRGIKEANFHVLRETSMHAVLTENGFMDNKREAMLMIDKDFQHEVVIEHTKGILEFFGLPYKAPKQDSGDASGSIYYRVVTGSFKDRDNAEKRVKELKKAGYDSFITDYQYENTVYHRVVTGSFQKKDNAEKRVQQLKQAGYDSFIAVYRK